MTNKPDKELEAISSIIALLEPLDEIERSRVLEYVLKRLQMATVEAAPSKMADGDTPTSRERIGSSGFVKDIRTLTAEKQPRSANEMVALIAYFLSEIAPGAEASETVNVDTIKRYFKMAGFPMPRVPKNALTNASQAGYLENVSRGEYRLNSVGYNLVAHALPRSNSPGGSTTHSASHAPRRRR